MTRRAVRPAGCLRWSAGVVPLLVAVACQAQSASPIEGIYTCTDANGRKLRSDRPIPACSDREQTVLNPSGTVRARIAPSMSPQQRAQQEVLRKEEAAEQARLQEQKRRDRALLARYPTRQAHDKERADANARVDAVVAEAEKRILALHEDRKHNESELEFYQGDASKAPPVLRQRIDYVAEGLQAQRRFIQAQENDRQRINARFDEELARLQQLWQGASGAGAKP